MITGSEPSDSLVVGTLGEPSAAEKPPLPWPLRIPDRILRWLENLVIIVTLAVMVLLPISESLVRLLKLLFGWLIEKFPSHAAGFQSALDFVPRLSLVGSSAFVQHGSLIVGLIGAAIAAREDRLLSLATASVLPKGWPRRMARVIAATAGGIVGALLCFASIQFIQTQRPTLDEIGYGISKWHLALAMPIGFGLITLSVLYHSAERWKWKWIAPVAAAAIIGFCIWAPINPERMVVPALLALLAATLLGAPIYVILGGATLILFWGSGETINSIPIDHYQLVTHPSLPTIPLFTLAGYFLAEGGASQRLVRVFNALFGSIRGGPAIVTALLCAFFTSFTGASGVTILALGGVLMPVLLSAKYSERSALGLLTGAGSLGMLFPPCLPLVLYAIIANVDMKQIFLGAIGPGIVLVVVTAALGVWMGPRSRESRPRFDFREAGAAIWGAKWELLIPVVALYALLGGIATPVEASAITAFYTFLTQSVFRRDLTFRKGVPRVMIECGLVIGGVLLILGVAQGFTNWLIFDQIPDRAIEWLTAEVKSPYVFLLILNFFLLIVGGLMDVYPAIIVVAPLVVPIGIKFGINPVHLGVIFLANLEMGFLMPPLGMNLLLASYRFRKPMPEIYRAILPLVAVQFVGVLLITYIPALTTWLPQMLSK